jgi:hypothetical protein
MIEQIPDLWYERRIGETTPVDRRIMRLLNKPIPKRGRYSALCHAKFVNTQILWNQSFPADAIPENVFLGDRMEPIGSELPRPEPGRYSSAILVSRVSGSDGSLRVYQASCSVPAWAPTHVSGSVTVFWIVGNTVNVANFSYNYDLVPMQTANVDLTRAAIDRLAREVSCQWTNPARQPIPLPSVDTDYVKARAEQAYNAALRFRDTELVDVSVNDLLRTPWAFNNIDFITGRARAYMAALDDIPQLPENNLQNIAAILQGLNVFAFGENTQPGFFEKVFKEQLRPDWYRTDANGRSKQQALVQKIQRYVARLRQSTDEELFPTLSSRHVDTLANLWLEGRYAFSTSVSDFGDVWDYFYDKALQNMGKRSRDYKIHAYANASDVTFRCTAVLRERALEGVAKFFDQVYKAGLEPNAYVLWDFVPFSFVVDWFFPVGDALRAYVRGSAFAPEAWEYVPTFDGKAMCYSVHYFSEDPQFGPVEVFTRWYESSPPEVEPAYFLHQGEVNKLTYRKREIDALCLIHGGI